jgi:hypothetical protein
VEESLRFALVIAFAANQASVLASLNDEALELCPVLGLPAVASCNGSSDGAPHGFVGPVATTVVLLDELTLELTRELRTERAEHSVGEPRRFRSVWAFLSPTVCELSSSQAISALNMLERSGALTLDQERAGGFSTRANTQGQERGNCKYTPRGVADKAKGGEISRGLGLRG